MNVRELIEILSKVDGDLVVEMGMNQEYQDSVDEDSVTVQSWNGRTVLYIGSDY